MKDAKDSIDLIGEAAKEALKESWKELLIESLPEVQLPLGPVETVALTWEHRSRARRKCTTSNGTKIALALPRGTVLSDGMLIYNSVEKAIEIKAEAEDVLVVKPANAMEMCVLAHHLGNWHRSLQLNDDGSIVVEHDSPLTKWLDSQKISYERERNTYHPNLKGSAHD
jgi:urease accessory protein